MGDAVQIRKKIIAQLGPEYCGEKLQVFDTLPSTSTRAKELAKEGAPHGTCVIALEQSRTRGKGGAAYFAPEGGLYLSMVMRPKISIEDCTQITMAAAVCVCEAIEQLSSNRMRIKWVNDVYLGTRKVCGILTEAESVAGESTPQYVILGVGINLREPSGGFPIELPAAGALSGEIMLEEIAAKLMRLLTRDWQVLLGKKIIDEYHARCFYA